MPLIDEPNPYAAPQADAAVAAPDDRPVVYLGFWKRVMASIVDNLIAMVVLIPAIGLLLALAGGGGVVLSQLASTLATAALILFCWRRFGATPGKMLFGAVIVDETTLGPPATGKLVLRYIGYVPSAVVLGLGFLWVAFDPKKRAWHDRIGGTVVVVRR